MLNKKGKVCILMGTSNQRQTENFQYVFHFHGEQSL